MPRLNRYLDTAAGRKMPPHDEPPRRASGHEIVENPVRNFFVKASRVPE
jgi:hypothetical protein